MIKFGAWSVRSTIIMNRRESLLYALSWPLLASADPGAPLSSPGVTTTSQNMLRSSDLLADAAVLRRAYETLHPGLLRYNTPEQMSAHFDALNQALSLDQSLQQAYLAFSIFAARIRCGHTYANFFNQTTAIASALFERDNRLPVHFVWLDRRIVVTRNFSSDPAIVPGTEILSIDDIPVALILERLMTIARADGQNDSKRIAWLQVTGEEPVEAFDVFLPLLFPSIGARQRLRVRSPGAKSSRVTIVDAITVSRRRETQPVQTDGAGPLWSLDITDPKLAVLRMPTWAMYKTRWDWQAWLQQAFDSLVRSSTTALVIDLRANEGGDDVGDVLLAHLTAKPLHLCRTRRLVRYRRVPDDLAPYLETWDPSFKDWGSSAVPFDDRFFRLARFDDEPGGKRIDPRAPRYDGRVFVLTGATNSSATFGFAQTVKQSGVATLVGQPTGGNLRGINGGAFFFLRLPNSRIELDLPLVGYFPVGELPPDKGVDPDILVAHSIENIADNVDAEMRAVRQQLLTLPEPT